MPRKLLIYHSPFFASALNGSFIESSGVIELPEDDPDIFEFFVQWLYVGKEILSNTQVNIQEGYPSICVKAWALGDKLGCLAFRDFFMIRLIDIHRDTTICTSTIRLVYMCSPVGSNLRKWAIHQFLLDSTAGYYSSNGGEGRNAEELRDLEDWGFDISDGLMRFGRHPNIPCNDRDDYLEVLKHEELSDD